MTYIPAGGVGSKTIVQTVLTSVATSGTTTSQIALDTSTPLDDEGGQVLTYAFTAKSIDSNVLARVVFHGSSGTAARTLIVTLSRTAFSDPVQATGTQYIATANQIYNVSFDYQDQFSEDGVGPHTYQVRAGLSGTGTLRWNGISAALLGGKMACTLHIIEFSG